MKKEKKERKEKTKTEKTGEKKPLPVIRPGYFVKVRQRVKEGDKERIQAFEGLVIAVKHGKGISATFTVRKMYGDLGVEKIYPLHLPSIESVEVLRKGKVRRAKLYYLRNLTGKKARLKGVEFKGFEMEKEEGGEEEAEEPREEKEEKNESENQ